MSDKVTIYINGHEYKVDSGQTIMQAADKLGYNIPRLCYHPKLSIEGACRVCIVDVEGARNFVASCAAPVAEGMKIRTNTTALRQARRDIVELILDNHPDDCHTCERDGNCELQRLSAAVGIRKRHFEGERKDHIPDDTSPSLVRNPNKCILCGRCVRMCAEVQKVTNLGLAGRGFKSEVMPAFNLPMSESVCAACGQCINICPTAAFIEKDHAKPVLKVLDDESKVKVVNVAPAVRAALGEEFGYEAGTNVEGKIFAALRRLGFNYVFDTQFTADLTIMEEGSELLHRINNGGTLPLITSCSPGWINCMESFYPDLLDNVSTCKSPMSMAGALIKSYFPKTIGVDPADVVNVAVMPCTAKKFESQREELKVDGFDGTDYVLTTRELAWLIKSAGIEFTALPDEKPDDPLGMSTGAATIFGATGGVMEAAIRTAYEIVTGEELASLDVTAVRGLEGVKEGAIDLNGTEVRVAVAHGLGGAAELLDVVRKDPARYHFIEIMACPGGCIGGGGQPYNNSIPLDKECLEKRASVLYGLDKSNKIRKSHENPHVKELYEKFLGEPLSEVSHKLLHTHYAAKEPRGVIPAELISNRG